MAGYVGGRIQKLIIRNFMTYDHVELYPKKGLNLIVGLNGSGKSSIMCAICLGLAGKPQFTGRATQLSEFIKHETQEAEIEIELESAEGSILISRRIKRDKCEWFLNQSPSNHNEVANAVKKFNIDTSNLCQFLPQEKVVEFSRMDKKQRLENMLQAIGEPHLFKLFNELKDLYKKSFELQHDIKKVQIKKNSAEEENERISDEVQKQESRVRLKIELDEWYKRKKVVTYQVIRDEVQQLREKTKSKETKLAEARSAEKDALSAERLISNSYRQQSDKYKLLTYEKRELINNITTKSSVLASFSEQVESAYIEHKNRLKEADTHKKKMQDLNRQIDGMEKVLAEKSAEYKKHEEQDNINAKALMQLQQEIHSLYRQMEVLKAEKNKDEYSMKYYQNQLSSLQDEHNKKMENLKKQDKFTYQAACWLIENKHRFKSNVYLPIMLEIKVHASESCKYVENTIGFRDMIAFVCEDKSDCERFTDFLSQQEIPVNVVMAPETPLSNFVSPPLTSALKSCGLECYVSDLFTAPDPVMRYLCSCYRIHNIPVAPTAVPANRIDFILQKYRIFFSEKNKITGRRSRYGNQNWSTRKDFIFEQNLLTIHNDELQKGIEQKLQNLQEQQVVKQMAMDQIESNLKEKENNQERYRSERKSLQDLKSTISSMQYNLQHKIRYRDQRSGVIDEKEENAKLKKKIISINSLREETVRALKQYFQEFVSLEKEIIKAILCMNSLSKHLKLTKAENEEIHEIVKTKEKELEEIMQEYNEKKLCGQRLLAEIKKMGEKYVKLIEKEPKKDIEAIALSNFSIEDIELKINHIQAQLNVDEDNEPLIADYNNRKRTIEAYQSEIDNFQCRLEEHKDILQSKKSEWLTPLQKHLANINKKFSSYFKQLSCAGEISLDIPDNSDDFTKYGLQIKLKFHDDEPLTELSQTHHSGGECSVAAIVFILSLQELTEVPFRCIDEINQGMDSVNERKIYQLIADSVGDDSCSQYFLLTPKLLMDLEYPDDVAVHIIFNTRYLNIKLDVKEHLEIAKSVSS